jgi:hypothetical protein
LRPGVAGAHLRAPEASAAQILEKEGVFAMRCLSHLTLAVLAGVLSLAGPSLAQAPPRGAAVTPSCHSHTDLTEMLDQKFAEQPTAIGLQSNGQLVEVFVANDGTSWTIVVTRPDGWSCIVAVGEHWELRPTGPLA